MWYLYTLGASFCTALIGYLFGRIDRNNKES